MPGMDVALSIFGVAFAALCVWLTVRIINRRERWTKWTLAVVVLPVLYIFSLRPMCYMIDRQWIGDQAPRVIYWPLRKIDWYFPDSAVAWLTEVGGDTGLAFYFVMRDEEIEKLILQERVSPRTVQRDDAGEHLALMPQ
jgi:hypothetical protein